MISRRKEGNKKFPLGEWHSNNCYRQDSSWVLKSVGESLRRKRIFTWFHSIFSKIFINYKGKELHNKKPGRHHLNQD